MNSIRFLCLALLIGATTGCFNVQLAAPHGQDVYLVAPETDTAVRRQWRTWYVMWGLTPLDNTMPAEIIQREQFNEVRVIVQDNLPDAAHGFVYNVLVSIGLTVQTIIIEGNRVPESVQAPMME